MKEIKLSGKLAKSLNLVAFVDDDDFDRISQIKWHAWASKIKTSGIVSAYYAVGSKREIMHRIIIGDACSGKQVDHKNRNGLDNQKHNLRLSDHSSNLANRPKSRLNTSGFKGVYRASKRWVAMISFQDKLRVLGRFDNREDAAMAYDAAATKQWGEFAMLNFPKTSSV